MYFKFSASSSTICPRQCLVCIFIFYFFVLVPYLSLPYEQLKTRLGGSLSLVLSGSKHYASLFPIGVLIKKKKKKKPFAIQYNALAGGLPADSVLMLI